MNFEEFCLLLADLTGSRVSLAYNPRSVAGEKIDDCWSMLAGNCYGYGATIRDAIVSVRDEADREQEFATVKAIDECLLQTQVIRVASGGAA